MIDIERLFTDNFETIYKYLLSIGANSDLAEEISQETIFVAIKSIDSFKGNCKLSSWLIQIAKNLYFKKLKEDKRFVDNNVLEYIETDVPKFIDKDLKIKLYSLIHDLDEPYKEVFNLRCLSDLSFKEIGKIFNKNESWARVVYYRARLKLKEELEDEM